MKKKNFPKELWSVIIVKNDVSCFNKPLGNGNIYKNTLSEYILFVLTYLRTYRYSNLAMLLKQCQLKKKLQ